MKIFLTSLLILLSTSIAMATEKTLNIIVGYPPAAAFHTYGLVLSRHITKHLSGDYKVTLRNMPGASGIVATNWIYNVVDKDSLTIALVNGTVTSNALFKVEGAKYDATKLNYIGSMVSEVAVCNIWHEHNIKTIEDARQNEIILGEAAEGAKVARIFNEFLGTRFKIVSGYSGSNEVFLAMERKEVQGRCGVSWSGIKAAKADWIRDKKINIIMQLSTQKHSELPNIPLAMDLAKNKEQRDILEILSVPHYAGRPLIASPHMSKENVSLLRKAFKLTMLDLEFQQEANQVGIEINPLSGKQVEDVVNRLYNSSKETLQKASDMLK